jgi:hypothetical protein
MRQWIEWGQRQFRFSVMSPFRKDSAVELVLGTLPGVLNMPNTDEEFMQYAILVEPK